MMIASGGYWGVGMVVGAICGVGLGMGPVGMWLGLASGLLTAGLLLGRRFMLRDQYNLLATAKPA